MTQNMTVYQTPPNTNIAGASDTSTLDEYAAIAKVVVLFVGTWILHAMTAHVPTPESLRNAVVRNLSMIFSPITTGVSSFNTIFIIAQNFYHDDPVSESRQALSASAYAVRIPRQFATGLASGWIQLGIGVPRIDYDTHSTETESVIVHLPRTARFTDDRYHRFMPTPSSNRLSTSIALIQLSFTTLQAYLDFGPTIRSRGLSSPYIVLIPYIYVSFLNLVANLLQPTYFQIAILLSTEPLDSTQAINVSLSTSRSSTDLTSSSIGYMTESIRQTPRSPMVTLQVREYLRIKFPGIEFPETTILEYTPLLHHTFAIVVLITCLILLTGYENGDSSKVIFLLAIALDAVLQPILRFLQDRLCAGTGGGTTWIRSTIVGIRLVCWMTNVSAVLVGGSVLYQIYRHVVD
jgi:hypothetical protein